MDHPDIDPVNELFKAQRDVLRSLTEGEQPQNVAISWAAANAAVNEMLEARMRTGTVLQVFAIGAASGAVSGGFLVWLFT